MGAPPERGGFVRVMIPSTIAKNKMQALFSRKTYLTPFFFDGNKPHMETTIKKITPEIEAKLVEIFGNKDKAANGIGITYRRFCQIRQRNETINRRLGFVIQTIIKNNCMTG